MNRTTVKLQLPFRICDRCAELDVVASLSSAGHYGWNYADDTAGTATRNIIVSCKNREVCERLHRMICEEIQQAQTGGEGVVKTLD